MLIDIMPYPKLCHNGGDPRKDYFKISHRDCHQFIHKWGRLSCEGCYD